MEHRGTVARSKARMRESEEWRLKGRGSKGQERWKGEKEEKRHRGGQG